MGGELRYIPFTEAVEVNPKVSLTRGAVYPFVDMKAVDPSRRGVTESGFREFEGGGTRFLPFDTLMARITPCLENGKIARYEPSPGITGPAFGSTEFIIIRGKEGVTDNDYAYYLTQWDKFRHFAISQMTGSSGRQRVPADSLSKFMAPVPPLPEQRAIAHILGTLDDKIELNRKMNQTLEAMAQAIFKSWFVDFDPVIDNALKAGKPIPDSLAKRAAKRKQTLEKVRQNHYPPLPKEIADLFPDEFEDSEIGPIPKGWKIGLVRDLGKIICGKTPSTKDKSNFGNDIPFITIPDMHNKVFVTRTVKYLSSKGAEIQKTKFLPANSICVSCIATPGLVVLTTKLSQTNQQINSVVPHKYSPFYCYELLSQLSSEIWAGGSGGSVFSNLSKGRFSELKVILSPMNIVDAFHRHVKPLFNRLLNNQQEADIISSVRDALLPKLISGELRVPDGEKSIEEAGV